ncbi:hypothetical protein OB236_12185 [Paenibacillus sp. WQ 127069]|uniref:Uncharacterized protein n=1 Tax=Paenibacillus baimaensis TaxID=2982185 RepID=A0ABT2UE08_9BACL|nr:hypothetical protein [Paenibacillus sp. WQ 127069]MCU6792878.1 hypothetical protein [Paenibacillus sp. WQ 127069]
MNVIKLRHVIKDAGLGTHGGSRKQQGHPHSIPSTNDMVMQLQRTIGNKALTQLMRSVKPQSTGKVIQRAIDPDLVEKQKEILEIPKDVKVRILELPKKSKLTEEIKTLNDIHKFNIDDLNELPIGKVLCPDNYEKFSTGEDKDEEWLKAPMEDHMDIYGGAAYDHKYDLVTIIEGKGPRDLLHEIGHFKQNSQGFNATNVDTTILEYHNVILNENLFEGDPRLSYSKSFIKSTDKSWKDLREDFSESAKNLTLLDEIEKALTTKRYEAHAELIKKNLVNEYFGKKTK